MPASSRATPADLSGLGRQDWQRVVSRISTWYTYPVVRKAKRKSVRLEASLVAEAQRASGAKSGVEAVRIALEELVERARFCKWVRKVAGKGTFAGHERE